MQCLQLLACDEEERQLCSNTMTVASNLQPKDDMALCKNVKGLTTCIFTSCTWLETQHQVLTKY